MIDQFADDARIFPIVVNSPPEGTTGVSVTMLAHLSMVLGELICPRPFTQLLDESIRASPGPTFVRLTKTR